MQMSFGELHGRPLSTAKIGKIGNLVFSAPSSIVWESKLYDSVTGLGTRPKSYRKWAWTHLPW